MYRGRRGADWDTLGPMVSDAQVCHHKGAIHPIKNEYKSWGAGRKTGDYACYYQLDSMSTFSGMRFSPTDAKTFSADSKVGECRKPTRKCILTPVHEVYKAGTRKRRQYGLTQSIVRLETLLTLTDPDKCQDVKTPTRLA